MNLRELFPEMAVTATVSFLTAVVVTYLYRLIASGSGTVDWETAFTLAVILGISVPLTRTRSGGVDG